MIEFTGGHPRTTDGVVQLRALVPSHSWGSIKQTPGNEDVAVAESRRRVPVATRDNVAGAAPRARGWVIQLGTGKRARRPATTAPVSYTHLRAHETPEHLVCRLLLEK